MNLYSIMPLFTDHVKEICDDIERQYKDGIATEALFSMALFPEGNPVSYPNFESAYSAVENGECDAVDHLVTGEGTVVNMTLGEDESVWIVIDPAGAVEKYKYFYVFRYKNHQA